MNKRVKQLWIEALTSGEYKQGQGCLRDAKNLYCCLGVLTDLYAKEMNARWRREKNGERYEFHGAFEYLPTEVIEWAGLERKEPRVIYGHVKIGLASVNDDPITFPEIAMLIEQQL